MTHSLTLAALLLINLLTFSGAPDQAQDDGGDGCRTAYETIYAQMRLDCTGTDAAICTNSPGALIPQAEGAPAQTPSAVAAVLLPSPDLAAGRYAFTAVQVALPTPIAEAVDGQATLTLVLYGAAELANRSTQPPDFVRVPVNIGRQGALVRAQPNAEAEVIAALDFGATVDVIGRTSTSDWLLVTLDATRAGWIGSTTISGAPLLERALVTSADALPQPLFYGPMQSLTLRTNPGALTCAGVPTGGLLLQAADVDLVTVEVNGVTLRFDGTLLLTTSVSDDRLTAAALEGEALVETRTGQLLLSAGEQAVVRAHADGQLTRLPTVPQPHPWIVASRQPLDLLPRLVEPPFNTVDLLTAFEPGTGFLTSMLPSDPCVVAWTVSVNLRRGPGQVYPVREAVLENFAAPADARATAADGSVWWRLVDGVWLAADNTVFGGDCAALPFIDPPPVPTPTTESPS
ncbi:MAG: SH3 domain-containing protein [Chloroflexota bacterium]